MLKFPAFIFTRGSISYLNVNGETFPVGNVVNEKLHLYYGSLLKFLEIKDGLYINRIKDQIRNFYLELLNSEEAGDRQVIQQVVYWFSLKLG